MLFIALFSHDGPHSTVPLIALVMIVMMALIALMSLTALKPLMAPATCRFELDTSTSTIETLFLSHLGRCCKGQH